MKRLRIFLRHLRSLPEEARRFLAGISIIILALAIFVGWSSFIPLKLAIINGPEQTTEEIINDSAGKLGLNLQNTEDENQNKVLSPMQGVLNTVKDLKKLATEPGEKPKSGLASIKDGFNKILDYIFK